MQLWDKFEPIILVNNKKLKMLLENNRDLFQRHSEDAYSNLAVVSVFLLHINEFEATRCDDEKVRQVLFPEEINSIFGVAPVDDSLLPSTESLEDLITKLCDQQKFGGIWLGIDHPYFILKENGQAEKVYLTDTPRVRQLYHNYHCFRKAKVRLESLNYALSYIQRRRIRFEFPYYNILRHITINGTDVVFVYEYCLSKEALIRLDPPPDSAVVNLHNWNGECCISSEAYAFSEKMNVKLLTMDAFYEYIRNLKQM